MIDTFRGKYAFLSNFYFSPIKVEGITYPTVEHAYQASKTLSKNWKEKVLARDDPRHAKRVGRLVPLRENWDVIRLDVMFVLVLAKFRQNKQLKEKLLATGNQRLVEGNWWHDTYWGICNGKGQNHLGKILMMVRKKLRKNNERR